MGITEMCPDGVIDLMESGMIDRQAQDDGSSAKPSWRLRWARSGSSTPFSKKPRALEPHSISYTNDPFVVAQSNHMVAMQQHHREWICDGGRTPYRFALQPSHAAGFSGRIRIQLLGAARSEADCRLQRCLQRRAAEA